MRFLKFCRSLVNRNQALVGYKIREREGRNWKYRFKSFPVKEKDGFGRQRSVSWGVGKFEELNKIEGIRDRDLWEGWTTEQGKGYGLHS